MESTTRVVIPALEASDEDAALMDDTKYGDTWNLKERKWAWTGRTTEFRGDNGVYLCTKEDSSDSARIQLHTDESYSYDGVHVEYNFFTNWCNAMTWITKKQVFSYNAWETLYEKDWGDCSTQNGQVMDAYFDSEQAPVEISISCSNYSNKWAAFRDCHASMTITAVKPIKRQFNIVVDNPESLDFIGMGNIPEGAVNPYEQFLVNGSLNKQLSLLTDESFSISPIENADGSPRYTRLVGVDAVKDGETIRVITLNGDSETPNIILDDDLITELAEKGFIDWKKSDNGSVSGTIHFRPVFEYKDVTIEVIDNQYGSFKTDNLSAGTHEGTFHMGDVLTMETKMSATGTLAGLSPSGFAWTSQTGKNGSYLDDDITNYINGTKEFTLKQPYYTLEPTFTEKDNQVVVQVSDNDLAYFDETQGLFDTDQKWKDGDIWNFLIEKTAMTNKVVEMQAVTKDSEHVPIWTTTRDQLKYSGEAFYIRTGTKASDNLVTLTVNRTASSHAWYSYSGSVYVTSRNLVSSVVGTEDEESEDSEAGESEDSGDGAEDADVQESVNAAIGALVACGMNGAYTDEAGAFTLSPMYLTGGTTLRYAVTYNGVVNICEVKLPSAAAAKQSVSYEDPSNPGSTLTVDAVCVAGNMVEVDSSSLDNAHFGTVYAVQDGKVSGVIKGISLSGTKTQITIEVEAGQSYMNNGELLTENVQSVSLFFKSQFNGDVHGSWSSDDEEDTELQWNPETGQATLTFDKFSPDAPELYDIGDVLYAQLITDRKVDGSSFYADDGTAMVYDPVSTGITVTTDLDYEPETMEYDMPLDAESIMGSLQEGENRATYGRFPFLSEITFIVNMASPIKKFTGSDSDVNMIFDDIDPDFEDEDDDMTGTKDISDPNGYNNNGYTKSRWSFNVALKIKETKYGGVRFMLAITANVGGKGPGYESKTNPYESKGVYENIMNAPLTVAEKSHMDNDGFDMGTIKANRASEAVYQSHLTGRYLQFQIWFGFYADFGYIEIESTDGSKEKSHDMVFMGGGGFFGANAIAGITIYAYVIVVPAYINFEGNVNLTVYAGISADEDKTLASYQTEKHHKYGTDFKWNLDITLSGQAALTIGVGLYKVLGMRGTGALGAELDYTRKMELWYPSVSTDDWGYGTTITFSGTIDLLFMSIPLWSYSWDGPWGGGFVNYFREVRKGNILIQLIDEAIEDGDGSEEARTECKTRADELKTHIDAHDLSDGELEELVSSLRNYARSQKLLTYAEWDRCRMITVAGVIGAVTEAILLEEESGSVPMAGDTSSTYYVRDHVDSEWVAGNGTLMSGYDPVNTTELMEDAYAQPSSRILSIGGNKMLMTFLDDRGSGDRTQASVLKYTIYDAGKDTWTEPAAVQDDATADSKPDLVDAGDKLILSWSSTTDEKYQALKDEIAAELKAANGTDPSEADVEAAMEADAARVMAQMDIFTVEFDKASQTFGDITQLTDDSFYDDYPQAVYDSETGDYIVMYSKTAQDTEEYSDTEEKTAEEQALLDLVNPYAADRTYSVLCYMLYNNQTDAQDIDGLTHEAGWATDYLFTNETELDEADRLDFLTTWNGQRFLSSPIREEQDGKVVQVDPPIMDLTACEGYNGLAAYAYTVDMDLDVDTGQDKALYLQFYDFASHRTYVPIRIAGDKETTKMVIPEDKYQSGYSYASTTEQVEVGTPEMVRNGGSTWLFWREDNTSLRYVNVSELLNERVAVGEGEDDWTYAVSADGTMAVDSRTGKAYEPNVQTVDFGSMVSGDQMNITDYQVFTDAEDNLYVVYTDTTAYRTEDPVLGTAAQGTALEVYITAKVEDESIAETTVADTEDNSTPASWSKPNRLTNDNNYNDGLAVAQDDDGDLIIVHNQYSVVDKRGDLDYLESHGLVTLDENGEEKLIGDPYVRSPISMMVTRCAQEGSVEVCGFDITDTTPQAGETVTVSAVLANNGLQAADGYVIDFYEYKDGKQVRKIDMRKSDDIMPVNTGRTVAFEWTVPSEGADGYSIQAVVKEKKGLFGYYDAAEYYSGTLTQTPELEITFDSAEQNGDVFDVRYTVTNTGNGTVEDGTKADLKISALHGDLKEVYGLDDNLLLETDLSGLAPGESKVISESLTIPVSVFRYCGYDALKVQIMDADGGLTQETGSKIISLDEPMNLTLNGGEAITLSAGESKNAALTYDTTVFLDSSKVVYSVEDNSVASVDEEGNVTAVGTGATTLTAAILPSGRKVSIPVAVTVDCPKDDTCPISQFSDADPSAWYHDGVHWALEEGVMNGTGEKTFEPLTAASRAMIVTMLWRMDGEQKADQDTTFKDVETGRWYTEAVAWAVKNNITNGLSEDMFGPNQAVTREQFTTFLYRYAQYKGVDVSGGANTDLSKFKDASTISGWAVKAFSWAVESGIINGMDPETLSPKTDANRAQIATMLMRYDLLVK